MPLIIIPISKHQNVTLLFHQFNTGSQDEKLRISDGRGASHFEGRVGSHMQRLRDTRSKDYQGQPALAMIPSAQTIMKLILSPPGYGG